MSTTAPTASPKSGRRSPSAPDLADDVRERLDAAITALEVGATAWVHLTLRQRATLMERLHTTVAAAAEEWADVAATS